LAALTSSLAAQTPSEVTLEASPRIFSTLAGLRATGRIPGPVSGPPELTAPVDAALTRVAPESLAPLQAFLEKQRVETADDLNAYISAALLLRPPPEFEFAMPRDQLPPDVWAMTGFPEALRTFYHGADLGRVWNSVLPAYEQVIAARQPEVTPMLLETRAYLRLLGQSTPARTYTVYVEWLAPPGLTSARNYGDSYYLVIHPQRPDFLDAVRHQYLHYLLDPITTKHAAEMSAWAKLQPLAERAPRLPAAFRSDLLLLATECFIQGVELRLRRLDATAAAAELDSLERSGFIFTRHFFHALALYEQDEPSMRFYFPELVRSLDVDQELARLARMDFEAAPAVGLHAPSSDETLARLLGEGEGYLNAGNYGAARERFERILRTLDPEEPGALYGLAILASQAGNREEAKQYFLRALERAREPHILGWAHVYLGRIYDLEGDRPQALVHYQAALALPARIEKVEQAARRGLEQPFGHEKPDKF
jgi:hypothetical protein